MAEQEKESPQSPRMAPPGLHHNRLSWAGSIVAFWSLGNIIFLLIVGYFSKTNNPYVGIFTWVIFPAFFTLGIVLFLLGIALERRRRHRLGYQLHPYPLFDFNQASLRRRFTVVLVSALFFLMFSAVGSFRPTSTWSPSTSAGRPATRPMEPEFTAYQHSPHARVGCVDCHIGPGRRLVRPLQALGAYQLYAVPSTSSRVRSRHRSTTCARRRRPVSSATGPSSSTAPSCAASRTSRRDEKNTHWELDLLIKIGGRQHGSRADRRHPLAHEHRQQGHLHRHRRAAPDHSLGTPGSTPMATSPSTYSRSTETTLSAKTRENRPPGAWTASTATTARPTSTRRRPGR